MIGQGAILRTPLGDEVELTRAAWQHAHVGDRVIVETDDGDVFPCVLELGNADMPIVRLACAPALNARRATVRHPRSGS